MVAMPTRNTTALLIDAVDVMENDPRSYLGISSIGEECLRKLWYGFHFAKVEKEIPQRISRIFNTGHIAENFIISDLKRIGYEVYRYNEAGEKVEMTGALGEAQDICVGQTGHYRGHTDGTVLGVIEAPKTEHLLEMKTHAEKYFKQLIKDGVKKAFPKHYDQMQEYMRLRRLTRALYVAYNKNTSAYYFERVKFDKERAEELKHKAFDIIISTSPPPAAFNERWWGCRTCQYFDICHKGEKPDKNCRTCAHCDIEDKGEWSCGQKDGATLTKAEQLKGCGLYKIGWDL